MIKNHRKLGVINHWKLLLYFTCCFTHIPYRYDSLARNCINFNEDNPDFFIVVDLQKNLIDSKGHANTDISDPSYWSHPGCEREIYGVPASAVGNASCTLPSLTQLPIIIPAHLVENCS